MIQKNVCWIILAIVAALAAGVLECHIRHEDFWANLLAAAAIFFLGAFIKEIIYRGVKAAIKELLENKEFKDLFKELLKEMFEEFEGVE
jgi:hypothetical protein